jgi:Fe2+ transport system protein FeoA
MKKTLPADGSLSALPAGAGAVVEALEGGHEFCARAANLGFTPGVQVKMVQNYGHGPLLVALRGTLVALGRGEAGQVRVRAASAVAETQ